MQKNNKILFTRSIKIIVVVIVLVTLSIVCFKFFGRSTQLTNIIEYLKSYWWLFILTMWNIVLTLFLWNMWSEIQKNQRMYRQSQNKLKPPVYGQKIDYNPYGSDNYSTYRYEKNQNHNDQNINSINNRLLTLEDEIKNLKNQLTLSGSLYNQLSSNLKGEDKYSQTQENLSLGQNLYSYQQETIKIQQEQDPPSDPWSTILFHYNMNSDILDHSAVDYVSEVSSSIDQRRKNSNSQQVILSNSNNYSYLVLIGEDGISHWLVPKNRLMLRGSNFDTFQALFNTYGSAEIKDRSERPRLIKPAKVEQLSTSEWKLIEKGEVQFLR